MEQKGLYNGEDVPVELVFKTGVYETTTHKLQLDMYNLIKRHVIDRLPFIKRFYFNSSAVTSSLYGVLTLSRNDKVYIFGIKTHRTNNYGLSRNYYYWDYKSMEHLVFDIKRRVEKSFKTGYALKYTDLTFMENMVLTDIAKYKVTITSINSCGVVTGVQLESRDEANAFIDYKDLSKRFDLETLNFLIKQGYVIEYANKGRKSEGDLLTLSNLGSITMKRSNYRKEDSTLKF